MTDGSEVGFWTIEFVCFWKAQFKKKVTCFGYQDTRQKIETNAFHPQKLINMHIYDNQLYEKVEDLNV